jgi:hypothetical protein
MQYTGALQLGKKKPRVFPNPGGVFLGVFPVYFRVYFLVVYFTRSISFIFRAVRSISLASAYAYLVRVTGAPVELGGLR